MPLEVGLQVMHLGRAMELLYLVYGEGPRQIWRVRLLFVEPKEDYERFLPDEPVSKLHSQHA